MGKKYVCKCPPVEFYDLAGVERWLVEMAGRGLTLCRWGTWRCKFKVGEPRTLRCRLDPNRIRYWNPEASDEFAELKESYRAAGWEYICSVSGFYLFESADPDAPELYTDPESKAMALRLLTRAVFSRTRPCAGLTGGHDPLAVVGRLDPRLSLCGALSATPRDRAVGAAHRRAGL